MSSPADLDRRRRPARGGRARGGRPRRVRHRRRRTPRRVAPAPSSGRRRPSARAATTVALRQPQPVAQRAARPTPDARGHAERPARPRGRRHGRRRPRRPVGAGVLRQRRRPGLRARPRPAAPGHAEGQGHPARRGRAASRPPPGSARAGCSAIALAPGDEDTVFAYLTSASDNRVVRLSIRGGRVGRPKALLTGIPTSAHHHGGRLLFAPDGHALRQRRRRRGLRARPAEGFAGRQDPADPPGRARGVGQPVRQPHLDLRPPQRRGAGLRRRRAACGRPSSATSGRTSSTAIVKGRNYGWPRVEGRSGDDALRRPGRHLVADQQLLTGRAGHHALDRVRRRAAGAVPVLGRPRRHRRRRSRRRTSPATTAGSATSPSRRDGSLWMTTSNTDGRRTPGRDDDKILRVPL